MKVRFAICSSVAALLLCSGAMAGQVPAPDADVKTAPSNPGDAFPAAATIARAATVTQEVAQLASTTVVAAPPVEPPPAAATPAPSASTKDVAAPAATVRVAKDRLAGKPGKRAGSASGREQIAAAAPKPMVVHTVGRSETGTAAWYGGRYVGRRTTSGDTLDTSRATAAHRTLPLNSLARVTNLRNGRSVVVKVTDRGPVSDSLLIDVSPRAADELHMKDAGLIPVTVEQVVEVPPDTK